MRPYQDVYGVNRISLLSLRLKELVEEIGSADSYGDKVSDSDMREVYMIPIHDQSRRSGRVAVYQFEPVLTVDGWQWVYDGIFYV